MAIPSKANVIHFNKSEVSFISGLADYLVEDEIFFKLRTDPKFREAMLTTLNVNELTVGRLGIPRGHGFYYLPDESPVTIDPLQRRSLGEYLRLGSNKRI